METKLKDQVVMRIILSNAQADAQCMCLIDRMAERAHDVSVSLGDYKEKITGISITKEILLRNKSELEGFSEEEMDVAWLIYNAMDMAKHKELRLGEAILACHKLRVAKLS